MKIKVTTLSTDIGEAMVKLIEQARVGNALDLVNVDSFFLPRFYEYLQPVDEYVSEAHLNDYFPFVREGMANNDGQVVAIWPETDARGLYYRTDLVPDPPETWEELINSASEISAEEDIAGYLFPVGRGEGTTFSMLPFFWAQGSTLIDDNRPANPTCRGVAKWSYTEPHETGRDSRRSHGVLGESARRLAGEWTDQEGVLRAESDQLLLPAAVAQTSRRRRGRATRAVRRSSGDGRREVIPGPRTRGGEIGD